MFNVLAGEKKSRVLSPATLVASVAAHILLVGGVLTWALHRRGFRHGLPAPNPWGPLGWNLFMAGGSPPRGAAPWPRPSAAARRSATRGPRGVPGG